MKKLHRLSSLFASVSQIITSRYVVATATLSVFAMDASASILSRPICTAYNKIFDNDFAGIAAGIGFIGLLVAHSMDEGDNKWKTSAIKIGSAVTGIVNIDQLAGWVSRTDGSGWVCKGMVAAPSSDVLAVLAAYLG